MNAVTDQAARLRDLARGAPSPAPAAPRRSARVIAIASGKGGVGKTSLSVNLACDLASRGRRTVLIDGDLGLGNADLMLGVSAPRHVGSLLSSSRTLRDVIVRLSPTLSLLPGGSGVASLAELDDHQRRNLLQAIMPIESAADEVIIDCGAGVGGTVLEFLRHADEPIVVATPEPTAIADAYALIKAFVRREPVPSAAPLALLANQVRDAAEGADVHARIAAVADRFLAMRLISAGSIRADLAVSRAVRARSPFVLSHPNCPAAQDVRGLSEYFLRSGTQLDVSRGTRHGFFGRLKRALIGMTVAG